MPRQRVLVLTLEPTQLTLELSPCLPFKLGLFHGGLGLCGWRIERKVRLSLLVTNLTIVQADLQQLCSALQVHQLFSGARDSNSTPENPEILNCQEAVVKDSKSFT